MFSKSFRQTRNERRHRAFCTPRRPIRRRCRQPLRVDGRGLSANIEQPTPTVLAQYVQNHSAFISRRSEHKLNNIRPIFTVKFNLFYNFSVLRLVYWVICEVENNMNECMRVRRDEAKICVAFSRTLHGSVSLRWDTSYIQHPYTFIQYTCMAAVGKSAYAE